MRLSHPTLKNIARVNRPETALSKFPYIYRSTRVCSFRAEEVLYDWSHSSQGLVIEIFKRPEFVWWPIENRFHGFISRHRGVRGGDSNGLQLHLQEAAVAAEANATKCPAHSRGQRAHRREGGLRPAAEQAQEKRGEGRCRKSFHYTVSTYISDAANIVSHGFVARHNWFIVCTYKGSKI
jgi:hypothetical protein